MERCFPCKRKKSCPQDMPVSCLALILVQDPDASTKEAGTKRAAQTGGARQERREERNGTEKERRQERIEERRGSGDREQISALHRVANYHF